MGERSFPSPHIKSSLCKDQEMRGNGAIGRTPSSSVWLEQECKEGMGREERAWSASGLWLPSGGTWLSHEQKADTWPSRSFSPSWTQERNFQETVLCARNQTALSSPEPVSDEGNPAQLSQVAHPLVPIPKSAKQPSQHHAINLTRALWTQVVISYK